MKRLLLGCGRVSALVAALLAVGSAELGAQQPQLQVPAPPLPTPQPFEPTVGQEGKDVVWVPTPAVVVDKMLDVAKITPDDVVIDLGSGDGRLIIAAAKRGARAIGVEYNPDMVALSRRSAAEQGVSEKATFVEGDMYEADISQATVMSLFLLPHNLEKLRPKFLDLEPGTRIIANTFAIPAWDADETVTLDGDCTSWCKILVWFVPAKVDGGWQLGSERLTFKQEFQKISGTLSSSRGNAPLEEGTLRGEQVSFRAAGAEYSGRVNGDVMEGTVTVDGRTSSWRATRVRE